jgi:hypothetical protein
MNLCCVRLSKCGVFNSKHNGMISLTIQMTILPQVAWTFSDMLKSDIVSRNRSARIQYDFNVLSDYKNNYYQYY